MQPAASDGPMPFTIDVIITDNRLPTVVNLPSDAGQGAWMVVVERAQMFVKGDNSLAGGNLASFDGLPCPGLFIVVDQPTQSFSSGGQQTQVMGHLVPDKQPSATVVTNIWRYSIYEAASLMDHVTIPGLHQINIQVKDYLLNDFSFYSPTASPINTFLYYNNITANTQPCSPMLIQLRFSPLR